MASVTAEDRLTAPDLPEGQARRKFRGANHTGFLPVAAALAVICVVFQSQDSKFLSPENISNLIGQIAPMGLIATGVVLILLIGEIDLSVGVVSGLAAAIAVVLNIDHQVSGVLAMLIGLAAGASVGLLTGLAVTKLKIPSFVVTLAGLLGWQGALLFVLGPNGSVNVADPNMLNLASTYYTGAFGWIIAAVAVAVYAAALLGHRRRRARADLENSSVRRLVVQVVLVAVGLFGAAAILTSNRGVPLSLLILLAVVLGADLLIRKTVFGRHILACGGNLEAARLSGVRVDRVRVMVFVLGGTLAAAGGLLAAGRLLTVSSGSGGGDLLLNSIAAAVIGGTSLFGGRGSAWAAVLGALVIGAISNGMDLLSVEAATKFSVTGAVLFAAVAVDSIARERARQRAGL